MESERNIMVDHSHPFVIALDFCFSDEKFVYMGMKYLPHGNMREHLDVVQRYSEKEAKFYAAQILLALETLHSHKPAYDRDGNSHDRHGTAYEKWVMYVDMKPENIMFDDNGYLKLIDFDRSVELNTQNPENTIDIALQYYKSPEMKKGKAYNEMTDWWGFGILLFEMIVGHTPFHDKDPLKRQHAIYNDDFQFPHYLNISDRCKDLIRKLLVKDPRYRLGYQCGAQFIKEHPWFHNMDWDDLMDFKVGFFENKKIGRSASDSSAR
jgi:serine/threonine protein kinase